MMFPIPSYTEYLKKFNLVDCAISWISWKVDCYGMDYDEARRSAYDESFGWSRDELIDLDMSKEDLTGRAGTLRQQISYRKPKILSKEAVKMSVWEAHLNDDMSKEELILKANYWKTKAEQLEITCADILEKLDKARNRGMSNAAAFGYIEMAMNHMGYKSKIIDEIVNEMRHWLDIKTEQEAENYYYHNEIEDAEQAAKE